MAGARRTGESIPQPQAIDDGVWPQEFQNFEWYTRAGSIENWGIAAWEDPMNPNVEFRRGDFFDLKDWELEKPEVLKALARVYQYWIALTDCDGFRADAVKHVSVEASQRNSARRFIEYAESIGKENFFITGEITDSNIAPGYVDLFGGNLDAVLGIIAYPNLLTGLVKGQLDPNEFFALYDEHTSFGLLRQQGRYIVAVLDDHDMSSRGHKERFAAHGAAPAIYQQAAHVVGVQLTTPGMPSIYYGTEQALDGNEDYHDYSIEPKRFAEDRYVREAMFGGAFGAFGTTRLPLLQSRSSHLSAHRRDRAPAQRHRRRSVGRCDAGRCTRVKRLIWAIRLRCPSKARSWRGRMVHYQTEVVMALNTNAAEGRGADVTVDAYTHPDGSTLTMLYRSDWSDEELRNPPPDQTVSREAST